MENITLYSDRQSSIRQTGREYNKKLPAGCLSFDRDFDENIFAVFEVKNKPKPSQSQPFSPVSNSPAGQHQNIVPAKAVEFKKKGNYFKQHGIYDKAIIYYNAALNIYPRYTDVFYNLGRLYFDIKNYDQAIHNFEKLVALDPKDIEGLTLLGTYYQTTRKYALAEKVYKQAIQLNQHYDFATRSLQSLEIEKLAQTNPETATTLKRDRGRQNLMQALKIIEDYNNPRITNSLKNISYAMGDAKDENDKENLAQYEHFNNRIMVSEKLRYASPEVIAAYIIHESVHADDKDSLTSVREEQDAFIELAKFWIQNNKGLSDPDLDIATKLYQQSVKALEDKVETVYKQRNPNISQYSPGHGENNNTPEYQRSKNFDLMIQKANVLSKQSVDNKTLPVQYKDYIIEMLKITEDSKDK